MDPFNLAPPAPQSAPEPENPQPVAPEAPAPEAAVGPASPESRPHASPRTQARIDPAVRAAPRAGARSRKPRSQAPAEAAGRPAAIVLLTSRVTGPDGRAVPRRTIVLAAAARADDLVGRGWARPATEAEADQARLVLD
ncbi:hypothetical protein KOAAANKH_00102 [Brevundimonas sp. NIBR10]|uniref:hypothetical protein n=1 Tax=Brevundimonas sp. NIBR10 TaxID=3015997 RepID=UPI0022F17348|nr:hypothetical protein [Brevundimonas sp. NIBR10]WGM45241.1 hypothetical protein KOAAANKH_00102 [Brevundimonas sp. NIBR10]